MFAPRLWSEIVSLLERFFSGEEEIIPKKSTSSTSKANTSKSKEASSGSKATNSSSKKKRAASTEDDSEGEVRATKKPKTAGRVINEDGTEMYELGNNRFVSVSEFKGKMLVNIREYYEKEGKLNPGKKGISLSRDQYLALKKTIKIIDDLLED